VGSPDLDAVSVGESATADEGCGAVGESEEVFGLAFVAAVEPPASGEPGHRSPDNPPVLAEPRGGLGALAGDAVLDAALAQSFPQVAAS